MKVIAVINDPDGVRRIRQYMQDRSGTVGVRSGSPQLIILSATLLRRRIPTLRADQREAAPICPPVTHAEVKLSSGASARPVNCGCRCVFPKFALEERSPIIWSATLCCPSMSGITACYRQAAVENAGCTWPAAKVWGAMRLVSANGSPARR